MKTLTRDDVIELVMAVMKVVRSEVALDSEQLNKCIDVVSTTLVESLQAAGYQLPWIKNIRKN